MAVTFTNNTAGDILTHLERQYGIQIPEPFAVQFGTLWQPREEIVGYISLTADYNAVAEDYRRKLKATFKLDVPFWQKDDDSDRKSKDIEGKLDMMGWEVRIKLRSAYVCNIVGSKPKPAPQYRLDEAEVLKQLTPEQLQYLVALKVAELEKPGVSYDVECKPA